MSSHLQLAQVQGERIKVMLDDSDKNSQCTDQPSTAIILDQATLILAQGGVQALSINSLAAALNCAPELLKQQYASQEQLLIEVMAAIVQWFEQLRSDVTWRQYGVVAIESLIRAIAEGLHEHSHRVKAYFHIGIYGLQHNPKFKQRILALRKEMQQMIVVWLRQAVALEEITRNADLEMMADLILSSVSGLIQQWLMNPQFKLELRLKQLAEIHIRNMFKNSHLYYSANYWGE